MKMPLLSLDAIDIYPPMMSSIAAVQETGVKSFKIIEVSSCALIHQFTIFLKFKTRGRFQINRKASLSFKYEESLMNISQ